MGSKHGIRTGVFHRCCQGASFGFGFVLTVLALMTMFWIAWCYFGLTIVQVSDTQRRAVVNYSYTSVKPSPSPTSAPVRSTTLPTEQTSINSISKLPTTASILRGSSRGEMPAKVDKKSEPEILSSLAKGDMAPRDRTNYNVPGAESRGSTSAISSPRGPTNPKDGNDSGQKASILSGTSSEESEEDRIYARKVLPPGPENRPEDRNPSQSEADSRMDISPTKVNDEAKPGSSRRPQEPEVDRTVRDDGMPIREYVDRDVAPPPRRTDSSRPEADSGYRDPDSDREYPRRYASGADRDIPKYDDMDDDRGSRSRYDTRDRGRDSDDRYSKGDTRIYPEERRIRDDRPRIRERYPDDTPRRGDDDRYRDYEETTRSRDRDIARPKVKIPEDRSPLRDDRYRDDDRYIKTRDEDRSVPRNDERYRLRDDERYRSRDDERYRARNDEIYRPRDDERVRSRDDDRYRLESDDRYRDRKDDRYLPKDDDRYIPKSDDRYIPRDEDRYKSRDDEKYRPRDEDKSRSDDRYRYRDDDERARDDEKYRSSSRIDDKDRYRSSKDEDRYVEPRSRDDNIRETPLRGSSVLPADDRRVISSVSRNYEGVRDYDVGIRDRIREPLPPSRLSRPLPDDDRYIDDRRPPRYDDDDSRISPTRTRIEDVSSKSSVVGSRYIASEREPSPKDERYLDPDDRIRNIRIQDSRGPIPSSSTRRLVDQIDEYQTRLPNDGTERNENSREVVVLDHRSYASEEDDKYVRKNSRSDLDDRIRRPVEGTRERIRDDERYTRRDPVDIDEYKTGRTRGSYDNDRTRYRDRYDDEYEKPITPREDRLPPLPLRASDSFDGDEERTRRRDSEIRTVRKDEPSGRLRSDALPRTEDRYYDRDDYSDSRPSTRRRYDTEEPISSPRDYKDDYEDDRRRSARLPARSKDPVISSSMIPGYNREPSDVVTREKRFPNSEIRQPSSRVTSIDGKDRIYLDTGSDSTSRDTVRPLSAKDVIEAAMRHSDTSDQNSRKVYYPVFDPRGTNLTSPEIIRPNERRGTTITAKKKRSV